MSLNFSKFWKFGIEILLAVTIKTKMADFVHVLIFFHNWCRQVLHNLTSIKLFRHFSIFCYYIFSAFVDLNHCSRNS